jgi:DegV family protein with EDD domain
MQVVTDGGADLAPEQLAGLNVHQVPFYLQLDGKSYRGWLDIRPTDFYQLLESSQSYPTTSQPSAGEFAEFFRERAKEDADIISINVTGGLSGTVNTARMAAAMVPEANITIVDAKTLSSAQGWQVIAAARAAAAGWPLDKILDLISRVHVATDGIFTLTTLKYLMHSGRISQFAGMVASLMNVKPVISIEKLTGVFSLQEREFTFRRAINKIGDVIGRWHSTGSAMVFQIVHGNNLEGAELMKKRLEQLFNCTFFPTVDITPVFGCHSGPGIVGVVLAPASIFAEIP